MNELARIEVRPIGTEDLCRMFEFSRQRASVLIRNGKFPNSYRIGNSHAIPKSDVIVYIESRIADMEKEKGRLEAIKQEMISDSPVVVEQATS